MTKERMGSRLLPAKQVRNAIERMVRSGAIAGSKAEAWSKKLEDEARVKETRERAEGGDSFAMFEMANWYFCGSHGFARDFKQSFGWLERGHRAGYVACTYDLGQCYLRGWGVTQDTTRGLFHVGVAAAKGYKYACFDLGKTFAYGHHGMPQDVHEATRWFRAIDATSLMSSGDDSLFRADESELVATWLKENATD